MIFSKISRNSLALGIITIVAVCLVGTISTRTVINIEDALTKTNVVHTVIIGSGPAGLGAALYCARFKRYTVVIEGQKPGGLLMETTFIENWPGVPYKQAPELIAEMHSQVENLGVHFLQDMVIKVDFSKWPFVIRTQKGKVISALSVIIATGAEPRRLGVPGEDTYWGTGGISTCAKCDAFLCKGKTVVVVGGGDSAIEEAIQLAQYARTVTILVRKESMKAASMMQDQLAQYPNIEVRYGVEIREILGDGSVVTALKISDSKTKSTETLQADRLFVAIGHMPNTKLFAPYVHINSHGYIEAEGRSQKTSIRGVFVAGDNEDSVYRQAITASAAGVRAAIDANAFLTEIGLNPAMTSQLESNLLSFNGQGSRVHDVQSLDDFADSIKHHELVIAYFYDKNCPECAQMNPHVEQVAQRYEEVHFVKVEAQKIEPLVVKFFVDKVPCVLVFQDGNLVARYNTVMNESELDNFVSQF